MSKTTLKVAQKTDYVGSRTIEFIVGENKNVYSMEMNTRLQVEHPVIEMQTGIDLLECQKRITSGQTIPIEQQQIQPKGHSIEVRVCNENSEKGFLHSGNQLLELINCLLDPSGLEAGEMFLSNSNLQLNQLIPEVIEVLEPLINGTSLN